MRNFDISKVIFYSLLTVSLLGSFFVLGLYSGAEHNAVYLAAIKTKNAILSTFTVTTEEIGTVTKLHPTHLLQPARNEGEGVTVNSRKDNDYIFMAGFFDNNNALRLVKRDGQVIARWPASVFAIFQDMDYLWKPPKTDWNTSIHGAMLLKDGSVVFNFDGIGMVKMDRKGNVVWTLRHPTHHSIELAGDGSFWVPGKQLRAEKDASPFPPFSTPFEEHLILKVSQDGKIQKKISVLGLFYKNGLESLLTSTGRNIDNDYRTEKDIVHLNKITELTPEFAKAFPMFEAGDLLLSIRRYNMLLVIDPDNETIKWWKIGPWIRQHDPEFTRDGKILVFNNNVYRTTFGRGDKIDPAHISRLSNILEYDPATNSSRILYGGQKGQEMLTVIRGKLESTGEGGLLIATPDSGRAFETDAGGAIVWEYINRYDEDEVALITEAKLYPESFFNAGVWD